jgi:hypothetical protein
MIYFIKDVVTQAVKIGYSKTPEKRLRGLQTATPNELVLLGSIHGGLEHEEAFHSRFAEHRLQGEWFKKEILAEVLEIIAKDAADPRQLKMNVIVSGDDAFSRGVLSHVENQNFVFQALDEQNALTPMAWIITGGQRNLDIWAWNWAKKNKVEVYRYLPNWRKYGRFAAFKVAPKMLRSIFDQKLLLAFLSNKISSNTTGLIKKAEKAGIPVVKKYWPEQAIAVEKSPSLL